MNRLVIQEGYVVPGFDGAKRKRKSKGKKRGKRKGSKTAHHRKMKACGKKWREGRRGKSRTWKSFLKKCLKRA